MSCHNDNNSIWSFLFDSRTTKCRSSSLEYLSWVSSNPLVMDKVSSDWLAVSVRISLILNGNPVLVLLIFWSMWEYKPR